jgi:hypothetical protein
MRAFSSASLGLLLLQQQAQGASAAEAAAVASASASSRKSMFSQYESEMNDYLRQNKDNPAVAAWAACNVFGGHPPLTIHPQAQSRTRSSSDADVALRMDVEHLSVHDDDYDEWMKAMDEKVFASIR